jgi:hypothetical protein
MMLRFGSRAALAFVLAGVAIHGCSNMDEETLALDSNGTTGSAALALEIAPGLTIDTVKAILKFPSGKTQEHTINVEAPGSTPTIYFRLPVAQGYSVQLKAHAKESSSDDSMDCESAAVSFNITANTETPVAVPVVCNAPGAIANGVSGTAKVTGTFTVSHAECDSILSKVVIAPATITNSETPVTIEAFSRPKKNATIDITANKGTLTDDEWNKWVFVCGAATGAVTFTVTAELDDCTETGTVLFTCPGAPATPVCSDGSITPPEVCDTNGANPDVLPAGTPTGSTCNATCTAIVPPASGPVCGDGLITSPEVCDNAGSSPDVLPVGTAPGSTCNASCTIILPPPVCGNGAIEPPEPCDTNGAGADTLPTGTAPGSTCNATCTAIVPPPGGPTCGDGTITAPEVCDTAGAAADVLPVGTAPGSTCNATCTAIVPPTSGTAGTCHHTCVEDLTANGACNGVFSPVAADSDAVIDCILGASWPSPNTFPAGSCANGNLLSCYCGTLTPTQCLTALPVDVSGACKNEILAGSGCASRPVAEQSQCVAQVFVNPANATGRAMAYMQCLQDNCPDICFAP